MHNQFLLKSRGYIGSPIENFLNFYLRIQSENEL